MCACPPGPMLPGMTAITLTLELDPAGETLSGFASDVDGLRRDFSGWLGLISALEALIALDSPTPTTGGSR
jgi:hypothetical protein